MPVKATVNWYGVRQITACFDEQFDQYCRRLDTGYTKYGIQEKKQIQEKEKKVEMSLVVREAKGSKFRI